MNARSPYRMAALLLCWLAGPLLAAPSQGSVHAIADDTPIALGYQLLARHAHDRSSFTQGLVFHQGRLFESSGLYGQSRLQRSMPGDTTALAVDLPARLFAEGLTVLNGQLYLLSWREGQLLRFDPETLALLGSQRYRGEGWGLTTDGTHLVSSDGSDRIAFRDPATFAVLASIAVRERGRPLERLNELEWIDGALWANVWQQDRIVRIDPHSGRVTHSLDLSALAREEDTARREDPDNTLNGIAWDPASQTLWVTGKRWQYLYQLQIPAL